jgi:hypothetical protein
VLKANKNQWRYHLLKHIESSPRLVSRSDARYTTAIPLLKEAVISAPFGKISKSGDSGCSGGDLRTFEIAEPIF